MIFKIWLRVDLFLLFNFLMDRSGKVWIGAELGAEYGVTDINGRQPPSHRAFFGEATTFGDAVVE